MVSVDTPARIKVKLEIARRHKLAAMCLDGTDIQCVHGTRTAHVANQKSNCRLRTRAAIDAGERDNRALVIGDTGERHRDIAAGKRWRRVTNNCQCGIGDARRANSKYPPALLPGDTYGS